MCILPVTQAYLNIDLILGNNFMLMPTLLRRVLRAFRNRLIGSITHVNTSENVLALTFDDGPHPQDTITLLDTLDRYDAKATFFVLGTQASRCPDIIRRMVSSGHALGYHSFDHPSFCQIGYFEPFRQLRKWRKAVGNTRSRLFRPPFGHQTIISFLVMRLMGYKVILWNRDVQDWQDKDQNQLFEELEREISPGAIVLLHDNLHKLQEHRSLDRQATIAAVDMLLKAYSKEFEFVTIPELLKRGKPHRQALFWRPGPKFMSRLQKSSGE